LSFALFLFLLLVITGLVWALEAAVLRSRRAVACRRAVERLEPQLRSEPEERRKAILAETIEKESKEPWWVEYSVSFFPVILVVFMLRSFLVEPFKIPSSSMVPTLLVGDFILVNKFTYGIRLPVVNVKVVQINDPQRGDVMVFRYPEDPSLDYIKRVVGLPGDRVEYRNKRLSVNGVEVPVQQTDDYLSKERMQFSRRFAEKLGDVTHEILLDDDAPAITAPSRAFSFAGNCTYNSGGMACTVPAGHYFMMGDNRDNSSDSRVWGFVPDQNIVGKAFFIWLNLNELGRFGPFN
jgi:signal peptidase I